MSLKRTNWTTEEVIELLQGQILETIDGKESEHFKEHNAGIRDCIEYFYDFLRPVEEFGAMAYDPETKQVFHVGQIPEEKTLKRFERPRKNEL